MKVRCLYFAWVREAIGTDEELQEFTDDVMTVEAALAALVQRSEGHGEALSDPSRLRFAIDQKFVDLDAPVHDGAEFGVFPPVTGG
ncbi:MAG: molybdopterin converting factor subunit 1 [Pacificimonas sp.]